MSRDFALIAVLLTAFTAFKRFISVKVGVSAHASFFRN
jgi:hypothetical protein